jgi:enamine deaminase RidA (YjgF/YER057c/UK114 family)
VGLALAAAGATYDDIVKITTYVVNYRPEHRAVIGKARASGMPPASTLVGVNALALPDWLGPVVNWSVWAGRRRPHAVWWVR